MNERERHNRRVMLQRVKTYWLVGVLQESLHGAELIDLAMAYRTSAVASARVPEWQQTSSLELGEAFDQPLPIGTKITDVYEQAHGTLLVMGEPGAGKTTVLLQLVSDLLARAELDETHPIPVVFSLASWFGDQEIGEWMVNELSNRYEVPRRLGNKWLHTGHLLPLLDGLDEVDKERRLACAQAINAFRRQHIAMATVVTCRSRDYQDLATQLKLEEAVVLQPLSMDQIDIYLASMGKRLAGLRAALQTDDTLRELAQSPLMLSIMTLAYYRMPEDVAISLGNRDEGRKLLFDVYVERMARYRAGDEIYEPEKTVRWLSWLAHMMARNNQTIFFLEGLQPNWLPRSQQRQFVERLRFTVGAWFLSVGALAGLLGLFITGWKALLTGVVAGAFVASLPVFISVFLVRKRINWYQVETIETLNWSWPWAWLGGAVGTLVGLAVGGVFNWIAGGLDAAVSTPWILIFGIVGGASQVLENALLLNEMKMRTTPGQGIARSRQNGRLIALLVSIAMLLIFGLAFGVGAMLEFDFSAWTALPFVVGAVAYLALSGGLIYGGLAVVQHRRLIQILVQEGVFPPDYVQFLDYAAERSLLRKVGGGYMFVHALLLEYFQNLQEA